ncbi:hypothetical protein ACP4OV_001677 [Aristida adscensionis]
MKGQFNCAAFVSVSLNPNMNNIFKSMLQQLGSNKWEAAWEEAQLINELRELLQRKRYIIVIDDIWEKSVWKTIKYALVENEYGSKVIITSRMLDIAKQAGEVYRLKPLSSGDASRLFCLRVLGTEDKCLPDELVSLSNDILSKCAGVPLAIITIASMLASKKEGENTHKCWSNVYRSMGSGLSGNPDVMDMRRVLSVSYYALPKHLKTCLLYLSLYPEDCMIDATDLIWKWIGEGFVCTEQGNTMYEEAEGYLNELINRSMVEPIHIDRKSMKAHVFRLHDMVLDLITFLSNEDHFLTRLDGQLPKDLPEKIRRLSFQTCTNDDVKEMPTKNLAHLRSLIVSNKAFNLHLVFSRFPLLRVLDLTDCTEVNDSHCKDICNLLHLRYLGVRGTGITEIPKEIENLQFLLVLDIRFTEIKRLPSTVVHLRQLMCLFSKEAPDGFGNLKSLQVFHGIVTVKSPTRLHDLGGLTKLRHVNLHFREWAESYAEPFLSCLSKMVSLGSLEVSEHCSGFLASGCDMLSLDHKQLSMMTIREGLHVVPRWISSLSALSILDISLPSPGVEDLQVLGSIPSLGNLSLHIRQSMEDRRGRLVIDDRYPFRCLTQLNIYDLLGGEGTTWSFLPQPGAMRNLKRLRLGISTRPGEQQYGDFGLENLWSLEHADVDFVYYGEKPKGAYDAIVAINQAISMNPNKPTLELQQVTIYIGRMSFFSKTTSAYMDPHEDLND